MSDECFKLNNDKCLMDQNINCTIDQSQALKQAMSKKQFKKLRKREKWLEVKTEVRYLEDDYLFLAKSNEFIVLNIF